MVRQGIFPSRFYERAPRLATIAAWVNQHTTLSAWIDSGFCDTDRKIPGTRIRRPGKGRYGNRLLVVSDKSFAGRQQGWNREYRNALVVDHNAAETYRHNGEVIDKLHDYLTEHPEALSASHKGE
jgi:hypothetical protein